MGIPGLDHWLTTPPEEPDWIEEAEKVREECWQPKDEREAHLLAIIDGLLDYIEDELNP